MYIQKPIRHQKLDFFFRESILVVLAYCLSETVCPVFCPSSPKANRTRLPWRARKRDRGVSLWPFGTCRRVQPFFSGKLNIRHPEEIRKTSKGHARGITGRPLLRQQASCQTERAPCASQKSWTGPWAGMLWTIRQNVAREYLESPCQGAFHV